MVKALSLLAGLTLSLTVTAGSLYTNQAAPPTGQAQSRGGPAPQPR